MTPSFLPPPLRRSMRRLAGLAALGAASATLAGCFTGDESRRPPPDSFYYPTGLVVSPGRTTLYVANSDFDLLYSGGSIQALDLRAMRNDFRPITDALHDGQNAAAACGAAGLGPSLDPWLNPGPCEPFPAARFIRNHAFIGAFASGLLLTHDPDEPHARLFAPVRGDPSITYLEVQDDRDADDATAATFRLDCGVDELGFCSSDHRIGRDPDKTLRGIQLPADPVGIAATSDGRAILTAHQTQAAASLLINDWDGVPELAYFRNDLANGPTELAPLPTPAFAALAAEDSESFSYLPGFALTYRGAAQLDVLRFVTDEGAVPPRPFIARSSATPITTNASAFDSRGVAVLDVERRACEATCGTGAGDPLACLEACAEDVPIKLFLANRSPASLLLGEIRTFINRDDEGRATSATDQVLFYDSVPLAFGPSRVEAGVVLDAEGNFVERIFAVCFDARQVFIIDPHGELEAVVRTGRGPHDIAIDAGTDGGEPYAHLHVGHFTDSYIGIVDLDQRFPSTYGQMFASVGVPTPPQESR